MSLPSQHVRLVGLRPLVDGQLCGGGRVLSEGSGAQTGRHLLHGHAQLGSRFLPERRSAVSRYADTPTDFDQLVDQSKHLDILILLPDVLTPGSNWDRFGLWIPVEGFGNSTSFLSKYHLITN